MWFAYEGEMGLIALSPEKVKDIIKMNKEGKLPKDIKEFTAAVEKAEKVVEPGYENVVGQDSLNRFENSFKKKKKKKKPFNGNNPNNQQQRKPNPNQQPKS
jgi:hypothetical protein